MTLIIYRFGSFFRSEKLWLPSMPFVLVSNLVHYPHLGSPLLLSCPFWEYQSVLLLTPWLSAIPQFQMLPPRALSPDVLWVHKPLPHLHLLTHHLTFHSIQNFSKRTKKMMFKAGKPFTQSFSSSISRMPLLIYFPWYWGSFQCLLASVPSPICSFSDEDRWGLAWHLSKNCRQILFGPLSIHPYGFKASQTGLWVKAQHRVCHSAPGTTLRWLPSHLLPHFPLL